MQKPERCDCRECVVCLIDARVRNEELKRRLEENKASVDTYLARKRREARIEQMKVELSSLNSRLKRRTAENEDDAFSAPLRLSSALISPPPPSTSLIQLRAVIFALRAGVLSPPTVTLTRFADLEKELVTLQRKHVATLFELLPLQYVTPREVLVINVRVPTGSIEKLVLPADRLEVVLGYAVHILLLLSYILDVVLPFEMTLCGSTSDIAPRGSKTMYPLYLTKDKSAMKKSLTMLGLNVSALCYSQGLVIPMEKIGDIFVNLLSLKQHPSLGRSDGPVMNFDVSSLLDATHEDDISAIDERREWAFVDSNS